MIDFVFYHASSFFHFSQSVHKVLMVLGLPGATTRDALVAMPVWLWFSICTLQYGQSWFRQSYSRVYALTTGLHVFLGFLELMIDLHWLNSTYRRGWDILLFFGNFIWLGKWSWQTLLCHRRPSNCGWSGRKPREREREIYIYIYCTYI